MMSKKKIIAALTIASVSITYAVTDAQASIVDSAPMTQATYRSEEQLSDRVEGLTTLLEYYDSIPDDVLLQGDTALEAWRNTHPIYAPKASFFGCSAAILWLIGSNAIGAAKLLKIKKYIKELGGVKEAVRLMAGASFSFEKMEKVGGALKSLALEILGVAGVKSQCFD